MAFTMRALKNEIMNHKRGILIGLAGGLIAAYYAISQGADLNSIAEAGKGLLDSVMARKAPIEIAKTKIYIVFGALGAVVGLIAHKLVTKK